MKVSDFLEKAISEGLVKDMEVTCRTSIMRNPKLGVIVETGVNFNLLGRESDIPYHAMGSKIAFENLEQSDYNLMVKTAQQKFDDPKLQHAFVAKCLVKTRSSVRIYKDETVINKAGTDKLFGSTYISDFANIKDDSRIDRYEAERYLKGLENIEVIDPSTLETSANYKKAIEAVNPKALARLSIEIDELIKSEQENVNAEYPDKTHRNVDILISKLEVIDMSFDEKLSNNKSHLLESLKLVSDMSKRHYIFHDDMTRRDEERNESFDSEDDERYAEEAYENSASDFENNKGKLDDELFYTKKRNERFQEVISEIKKVLTNESEMSL